jgi:hypothetical protein
MAASTRLAPLLVALPLMLSACGQTSKDSAKDFSGPQKAVAQAVEDLQSAGSKADADKICTKLLAPALVTKIKAASRGTCQQALKDALRDADSFDLEVKKVTITGKAASAVVVSKASATAKDSEKDRTDTLRLVQDGGAWKIATLGAAS